MTQPCGTVCSFSCASAKHKNCSGWLYLSCIKIGSKQSKVVELDAVLVMCCATRFESNVYRLPLVVDSIGPKALVYQIQAIRFKPRINIIKESRKVSESPKTCSRGPQTTDRPNDDEVYCIIGAQESDRTVPVIGAQESEGFPLQQIPLQPLPERTRRELSL